MKPLWSFFCIFLFPFACFSSDNRENFSSSEAKIISTWNRKFIEISYSKIQELNLNPSKYRVFSSAWEGNDLEGCFFEIGFIEKEGKKQELFSKFYISAFRNFYFEKEKKCDFENIDLELNFCSSSGEVCIVNEKQERVIFEILKKCNLDIIKSWKYYNDFYKKEGKEKDFLKNYLEFLEEIVKIFVEHKYLFEFGPWKKFKLENSQIYFEGEKEKISFTVNPYRNEQSKAFFVGSEFSCSGAFLLSCLKDKSPEECIFLEDPKDPIE